MSRRTITFKVKRWNPHNGRFFVSTYNVPVVEGMTVLDALMYIKENLDATLSFRGNCRMAACGTCAIIINGVEGLACATQVLHLKADVITLEPLKNLPLVRDLVVDHTPFFEKQAMIKPYLIRKGFEEEYWDPIREYHQTPKELEDYIQFAYCITCASCYSACPTAGTNVRYLGPQALMNAYRFIADSRDEGLFERLAAVDTPDGCWGCHLAGSCSKVCPKGCDPALAIQLLRRKLLEGAFGYLREKRGKPLVPTLQVAEKKTTKTYPPFNV